MTGPSLPDTKTLNTLPKLLAYNARHWPDETAMREKAFGIWNVLSWRQVNTRVAEMALAMRARGIGQEDVVGLIGDNRPEWVMGEIAAHAVGAMSLGLYRDSLDDEIDFLVNQAQCRLMIVEDEEQVDKLLNIGDRLDCVETIVYCDPRGLRKYDDPRLIDLKDFLAAGRQVLDGATDAWDRMVAATDGEAVAILCTTSGTTSKPKMAMLRSRALIAHCASYLSVDPKLPEDEYVSVLPLPWIMEQIYALGMAMISRMTVNFVEEPETTMADMREIGPTFILLAPRVWEGIVADVRSRMMDSSAFKNRMFDLGMKHGLRALDAGRTSPLADLLLFRALKDRLGFTRLRSAATGGAALGPETFRFFLAMGVPLRQLYGQTELLGAYTIHRGGDIDFDTVGLPFDDSVSVRIDNPDPNGVGEIVTKHPNMFAGYYKNEEATREDINDAGEMHTGDAGYFNAKGHLVVIDRIKDLAVTVNGDRFSPQFIENKLKFSPFVAEAVILGHERPYLAAMICIRFPIVSKWAEKNRISFTTYTDLSARDEVYSLLEAEVRKVNETLPAAQRIRKFLLLYKELDADDGELTRTRKVRRGVIHEKYGDIVDAMYADEAAIPVDTTIAFQDGTKQRIRTTLRVVDLDAGGAAHAARSAAE
ncbi:long-chain fatty acid--CoA ligase [Fodinicurvata sp. EGI_FJ10296]|uniref:long-chain fatty acid--CoA ligase n=1 Tax=Fodinicurvata sp. EGI_FJ10296 TaxID=3231908 RepID=UPI003451F796